MKDKLSVRLNPRQPHNCILARWFTRSTCTVETHQNISFLMVIHTFIIVPKEESDFCVGFVVIRL